MLSYEEIKERMQQSIGNGYLRKKEMKALPTILVDGEIPQHAVGGSRKDDLFQGLLVATDQRLIYIYKSFWSSVIEDLTYDKIASIECKNSWSSGEIIIHGSGNRIAIENVLHKESALFVDWVRNYMSTYKSARFSRKNTPTSEDRADKIIKQLKELGELKTLGILTEEEFQAEKDKILNT